VADVSVRPARAEDAARIAAVQLSTWRTAYEEVLPPELLAAPEADVLREVAAAWEEAVVRPPTAGHRVLVAMDGDELVGLAASEPVQDGVVELSALLVEPRWGRRGHGSRLVAASVDHWREDATKAALTWVWEQDAASTSFLASSGWEPDGAARSLDSGARQLRFHVSLADPDDAAEEGA
jgi:GNAT superfamily N-acetyltransferase